MTDKIAYLITEHGVDGRAAETIVFASYDEQERDGVYDASKNKNYYSKTKRIVEVEHETKQALAKLNGVHRMMLNLDQRALK